MIPYKLVALIKILKKWYKCVMLATNEVLNQSVTKMSYVCVWFVITYYNTIMFIYNSRADAKTQQFLPKFNFSSHVVSIPHAISTYTLQFK